MSKFVSIQWSHQRLLVVAGSGASGGAQAQRAFSIDLPAEQATEKSISEAIQSSFRSNGIGRSDAIVVLDRDCVEIRQFDVPPVPADELPDLVQFQASTQFTAFNNSWALDYVPVDFNQERLATSVLACAISPQLLDQIKECLEGASLKIRHITVRGFSTLSLVKPTKGDGEQIIVQQVGDEIDMTAIDGASVLLTRTVKLPSAEDAEQQKRKINQEFKRTLASCSNQHARENFESIKIIGNASSNQIVADAIDGATEAKVSFIDPSAVSRWSNALVQSVSDPVSDFGPAVGGLVTKASGEKFELDLLNPRSKPKVAADKSRLYIWGGIAAAVVIAIFGFTYWVLNDQANSIAKLEKQVKRLREDNKPAEQFIGEVEKIDQWKRGDINLLDHLATISDRMPLGDDAIVDDFNGTYNLTNKDYRMNLSGGLANSKLSRDIDTELRKEGGYDVDPGGDTPRVGDPAYAYQFRKALRLDLESRELSLPETEEVNVNAVPDGDGKSKDTEDATPNKDDDKKNKTAANE